MTTGYDIYRSIDHTYVMLYGRSMQRRYSVVVITWDSDTKFPKPRFEPW